MMQLLATTPAGAPPASVPPLNDADDFARLRKRAKASVKAAHDVCLRVWRRVRNGQRLTTAAKAVARETHWHWTKVKRLWQGYCAADFNWRALVNKRHQPEWWDKITSDDLPDATKVHWKSICEGIQGDDYGKTAYQMLLAQLHAWRRGRGPQVPGYDTPPPNAPGKPHPAGWSYSNLMRHRPQRAEHLAATDGREAALAEFPGVRTTRAGMYPFAEIQFDDMWHDFEVMVVSANQLGSRRLLEFGAVDLYSGYLFTPGLKPRLKDMDTDRMQHLLGADFLFYLAHFLTVEGWHPAGTVLNVENGTAAIPASVEAAIFHWTEGAVTVRRAPMTGARALPGQHEGRSKGNFRAKALKEGLGKLIHNRLKMLPGQVGGSYAEQPALTTGLKKHNELLQALCLVLPELEQGVRFSMLRAEEACAGITTTYDLLNRRKDHEMEGWESEDLLAREFCMDPQAAEPAWQRIETALGWDAARQQMLESLLAAHPEMRRLRRLSPLEVLHPVRSQLKRLPHCALPDLLGRDLGTRARVQRKCFEVGGRPYLAEVRDKAGYPRQLANDDEYLVFLNPFAQERLIVADKENLQYIGECVPWEIPSRADADAVIRAVGHRERLFKDAMCGAAGRLGLGRGDDFALNAKAIRAAARARLAKQDGPTPAQTAARLRAARREPGTLQDLMHAPCSAPATAPAAMPEEDPGDLGELIHDQP